MRKSRKAERAHHDAERLELRPGHDGYGGGHVPTSARRLSYAERSTTKAGISGTLAMRAPPLLDERGALRRYVHVFVNGDDVRALEGLSTPTPRGAYVSIVTAVAGG
jgi:molybdopterin converting factor small subunit